MRKIGTGLSLAQMSPDLYQLQVFIVYLIPTNIHRLKSSCLATTSTISVELVWEGTLRIPSLMIIAGLISVIRIIAVLLGRLRCSVPEAMEYYGRMWKAMASRIPPVDRVLPGNKIREDCSMGMDHALEEILNDQREIRRVRTLKGNIDDVQAFRTESSLCRTYVGLNALLNYLLITQQIGPRRPV